MPPEPLSHPRRVVYIDFGLRSNAGHHAEYCRAIGGAFRDAGLTVAVMAHRSLPRPLATELAATPCLRTYTYGWHIGSDDPVIGWLLRFEAAAREVSADLAAIHDIGPSDLVYLNSIQAPFLAGAIDWLAALPPARRPVVVMELGLGPGVGAKRHNGELLVDFPDPRVDPNGLLYRLAGHRWSMAGSLPAALVVSDKVVAAIYAIITKREVVEVPVPRLAVQTPRNRVGSSPIHIAWIGHQRHIKGFHMAPPIVREMLRRCPSDIRFLIHNSEPLDMPDVMMQLKEMANIDNRIIIDESALDHGNYERLLDRADIIACPYDPAHYRSAHSGVVSEALANGAVVVAPANSSPGDFVKAMGQPGVLFADWKAQSVLDALLEAVENFPVLAAHAQATAAAWPKQHGPNRFVESVLNLYRRLAPIEN